MDNTVVTFATTHLDVQRVIELKIVGSGDHHRHDDDPGTESVKNHGQYVKAQGGGKIAAQACAGMPVNSTQGK